MAKKTHPEIIARFQHLRAEGKTYKQIARKTSVHWQTVARWLRQEVSKTDIANEALTAVDQTLSISLAPQALAFLQALSEITKTPLKVLGGRLLSKHLSQMAKDTTMGE